MGKWAIRFAVLGVVLLLGVWGYYGLIVPDPPRGWSTTLTACPSESAWWQIRPRLNKSNTVELPLDALEEYYICPLEGNALPPDHPEQVLAGSAYFVRYIKWLEEGKPNQLACPDPHEMHEGPSEDYLRLGRAGSRYYILDFSTSACL